MEFYDVIVVGGGPAGSTCATLLGKKNRKVLLLDKAKFPRDKTCGDGITGKSRGFLEELNLIDEVEKNSAIYDGIDLTWPYGSKTVVKTDDKHYSYVCKRIVFDNILFQNAKNYVDVREEFYVTDVIVEDGKVVGVRGTNGPNGPQTEFRAKIVVGADGANSVIATKLGLNKFNSSHRLSAIRAYYKGVKGVGKNLEIMIFKSVVPGYFWIFPLPNGMANVGIGMVVKDMQKRKISLQKTMEEEIANNPIIKDRFEGAELVSEIKAWTLPAASAFRKNYGNGFVLIGDAASLIDPLSGEGIGNAMLSASIAADIINESLDKGDFSEEFLKRYSDNLWKVLSKETKSNYISQKILSIKLFLKLFESRIANSSYVIENLKYNFLNEKARPIIRFRNLLSSIIGR